MLTINLHALLTDEDFYVSNETYRRTLFQRLKTSRASRSALVDLALAIEEGEIAINEMPFPVGHDIIIARAVAWIRSESYDFPADWQ
jgi:hypothetical protein